MLEKFAAYIPLILILVFILPFCELKQPAMYGQDLRLPDRRDDQLFRSSQSYINLQRYNLAIPVLEDLLRRNPKQVSYYNWLLRAYLSVSAFERADSLIAKMQNVYPDNPQFMIDKGSVLLQKNKKDAALQLWKEVIEKNPTNLNVYNQVANTMVMNRLSDEAIALYHLALERFPKIHTFYLNIANLYKNQLQYIDATEYYLKYLAKEPKQRNHIFNQILSFELPPEERQDFFTILQEKSTGSKQSFEIKLLLAQLYQRYNEFEKAYQIYFDLEDEKSGGGRLLRFAQAAQRDSSYNIALRSYLDIISNFPESPALLLAYKGAVSTLYLLSKQTDRQLYAKRALSLIDSVQSIFPENPEIPAIVYNKGIIYLDFYFDLDQAAEIFSRISGMPTTDKVTRAKSLLKLGEVYMLKGQFDLALKSLNQVTVSPYSGKARLQRARIHYFNKEWDKTNQSVQEIISREGTAGAVTNDALALKMKVDQAKQVPDILSRLAEAEMLLYQRKKAESIKELLVIKEMDAIPALIKSDVFLHIIEISIELENYPQALEFSIQAIQDSALLQYADKHLFLMATLLENHLHRYQQAFDSYHKLVATYPNSLLAARAREKMKQLKEKKLIEIP